MLIRVRTGHRFVVQASVGASAAVASGNSGRASAGAGQFNNRAFASSLSKKCFEEELRATGQSGYVSPFFSPPPPLQRPMSKREANGQHYQTAPAMRGDPGLRRVRPLRQRF